MTFTNQTNRTSVVGDGTTQAIPFLFPASDTSEIVVRSRVIATGVQATLTENSDYTVVLTGDTGGTVTMITTFASTSQIHVIRNTPNTQQLDLENGDDFNAENLEDAFDKNAKLTVENKDTLARTLVFPVTDPSSSFGVMPNSIDRAGKTLTFDDNGVATASTITTGLVTHGAFGTTLAESATAASARTSLSLGVVDVRAFATFELAIDDIGATDTTLLIPTSIPLASSKTVPENVTLKFTRSGLITIATGQTLTVNGPIEAGEHAIFAYTTTGTAAFGVVPSVAVRASWFATFETDIGESITDAIGVLDTDVGGKILLPAGSYNATTVINCAYIDSEPNLRKYITFQGVGRSNIDEGSRINIKHTGIGFDCVGSKYITFKDFTISGDSTTSPTIGILLARPGTASSIGAVSVGQTSFFNMNMWGTYTVSDIYNYASELDFYFGCRISNAGSGSAVYLTGDNTLGINSALSDVVIDTDVNRSNSMPILAYGCTFQSGGSSNSIRIRQASEMAFEGCFFVAGAATKANSNFFVDTSDAVIGGFEGLSINNCRFETGQLCDYIIQISGGGGTVASNLNFTNNSCDCDVNIISTTDTLMSGGTIKNNKDVASRGYVFFQLSFVDFNVLVSSLTISDFVQRSVLQGLQSTSGRWSITGRNTTIINDTRTGVVDSSLDHFVFVDNEIVSSNNNLVTVRDLAL